MITVLMTDAVKGFGEVNEKHNPWRVVMVAIVKYVVHATCHFSNESLG